MHWRDGGIKLFEQEISSFRHPLIKQYIRLAGSRRYRHRAGKIALEGPNLVGEALRAGIIPEAVFYTHRYREGLELLGLFTDIPRKVKRYLVTPQLFRRMALTDSPQEVAALVPIPPGLRKPVDGKARLGLLLDRLRDPGNLGTIIRTAVAVGAGVSYTPGTVDPYSPKVLRSTAGTVFHHPPVFLTQPLKWFEGLKKQGTQIITTDPGENRCYWELDLRLPTVFIIGNESHGVAAELAAQADRRVSIPQPGWGNSLNAAISAAILLYEALRQRS